MNLSTNKGPEVCLSDIGASKDLCGKSWQEYESITLRAMLSIDLWEKMRVNSYNYIGIDM